MGRILDFTEENGLVSCSALVAAQNNSEILYLNEAQKLGVEAVLFRRYYQENESKSYRSEPAVCVFNKKSDFFNSDEHIKLHAALWSAARNEIYIIKSQNRLDIINARKPAELGKDGCLSVSNLLLATSTAIETFNYSKFSAYLFGSGTFWEQPEFEEQLDEKNSPYIFLLDYLLAVRKFFLGSSELRLEPDTIDKLLVTSILIKFLEEITDDQGKHTLRNIYKKYKISTFAEAVEQGNCVAVLNELSNEFNGKIFDNFSNDEKQKIEQSSLTNLANFLKANIDVRTNQLFFWEQYSFKHLPAEVISAIYENFIQAEAVRKNGRKEKGVVYTPVHLVNLLIDEVMPLEQPDLFKNNIFKVLDPSCGSGVFLVSAFKRMLQWWAILNSTPENIKYPDSKIAQKILEENIFGVDVKKTATLVSVFSLTTALLDKLTPQEIWNKLRFKDLSQKNIKNANFFEWAITAKNNNQTFDLIIGNPPFNVETGKKKHDVVSKKMLEELRLNVTKIPNNNFAIHFFETAMLISKKVSMILPASVLLYNRSTLDYRRHLFTNYTVKKIFDLTHLRRDLFHKTADTPVVALISENIKSDLRPIEHVVIKRTTSTEKKIRFEIDYYDIHKVKWDWAVDERRGFVWKSNLLGGGRLFQLASRLSLLDTISSYVENKQREGAGWIYSTGYKIGGQTKKKKAPFINNGDKIEKIFEDGKYQVNPKGERTNLFEFYPDQNIYVPPMLIFDQVIGRKNIPVSLVEHYEKKKFLYFSRDFVGISAPQKDISELKKMGSFIREKYYELYRLYALLNSGSAMILTETEINKRDIDLLPFPENEDYLMLSDNEKVIVEDTLRYNIHLGKAINGKGSGSALHQRVSKMQLFSYGKIYCDTLNEIYSRNNKSWQIGAVVQTELYSVFQVGFGRDGKLKSSFSKHLEDNIKPLIEDGLSNSGALYMRIIKLYSHQDGYDCVFFIKPNALRYWLGSIALRDADDTLLELKKAGF